MQDDDKGLHDLIRKTVEVKLEQPKKEIEDFDAGKRYKEAIEKKGMFDRNNYGPKV